MGSQIESHGKGNEAPQSKFHIDWNKRPSLRPRNWIANATNFDGDVLRELVVSVPAMHMITNGPCMEMDKALKMNFCKQIAE